MCRCAQFVVAFCLCALSVLVFCARFCVILLNFVAGKWRDRHLENGTREVNIFNVRVFSPKCLANCLVNRRFYALIVYV